MTIIHFMFNVKTSEKTANKTKTNKCEKVLGCYTCDKNPYNI